VITDLRSAAAAVLIGLGTFFFFTGTLGLLRMPDVYTRLHVAAKADSLGAGMWLIGLALISGSSVITLKLVVLTLFVWITGPTAAHCMARAAYRAGVRPQHGTGREKDPRCKEDG
jgi:multicomponent Na+:H+ antiporter subunit G